MDRKLIFKNIKERELGELASRVRSFVDGPALILLEGPLGAGKTAFSRAFINHPTPSPTYTLLNECEDILHGDFYRLEDENELEYLELALYLEGKKTFLLEWGLKWLPSFQRDLPKEMAIFLMKFSLVSNSPELRSIDLRELTDSKEELEQKTRQFIPIKKL